MSKILQTITTITVPKNAEVVQCREGWVDMSGFETVSVFAEVYGRRTRNNATVLTDLARLFIQNSISGDVWEDLDMSRAGAAAPCDDGPNGVVFQYGGVASTDRAVIKGPLFRWKVDGKGGGLGTGEITFRVVISGGSPCC
jgi:hypothetical protein